MRRRLLETRLTGSQMAIIATVSACATVLVALLALGPSRPYEAILAALTSRPVVHAPVSRGPEAPSAVPAQSAAVTAAAVTPASPPATGSSQGGTSGGGASQTAGSSSGSGPSGSGSRGSGSGADGGSHKGPTSKVKHVFIVMVSTPSFQAAFGSGSIATYLNSKLRPRGELLSGYRTLSSASLPDYLALISGQSPNSDTLAGCPTYVDFAAGATPTKDGQTPGAGCVYPNTTLTVGDQMDSADLHWRAYVGAMTSACEHPNSGAANLAPTAAASYSSTVNPFVYFHSLLDLGDCQSYDQPLTQLQPALRSATRTPSYVFIAPDACSAGLVTSCPTGQPTGLAGVDAFLQSTVPAILRAPAYRHGGALLILFTAAPATASPPLSSSGTTNTTGGTTSTTSTTTGAATTTTSGTTTSGTTTSTTSSPTTSSTTTTSTPTTTTSTTPSNPPSTTPTGPVRTGALVISPYTHPGSTDAAVYDPDSVLRSVEDIFGLTRLAGARHAKAFDRRVFTR